METKATDSMYMEKIEGFYRNPEFLKLAGIGGHKRYHLEGNALEHTRLVIKEAVDMFGKDSFMVEVAALHDVGKIYTSICHGENDWEYPDHSTCGAMRGILCKFIPETDEHFKDIQWYVRNHIKPLFLRNCGDIEEQRARIMRDVPSEDCTFDRLIRLAICDIKGSYSVEPQDELLTFLEGLLKG